MITSRCFIDYECKPKLVRQRSPVDGTKRLPIIFRSQDKTVPMPLETVGKLLHVWIKRFNAPDCAQVVVIRFVLLETDNLALTEFNQQGDVSLADGSAQIAGARQTFSLSQ